MTSWITSESGALWLGGRGDGILFMDEYNFYLVDFKLIHWIIVVCPEIVGLTFFFRSCNYLDLGSIKFMFFFLQILEISLLFLPQKEKTVRETQLDRVTLTLFLTMYLVSVALKLITALNCLLDASVSVELWLCRRSSDRNELKMFLRLDPTGTERVVCCFFFSFFSLISLHCSSVWRETWCSLWWRWSECISFSTCAFQHLHSQQVQLQASFLAGKPRAVCWRKKTPEITGA